MMYCTLMDITQNQTNTDPTNVNPETGYDPRAPQEGRVALVGAGVAAPDETIASSNNGTAGAEVWTMDAAAPQQPPPDVGPA